MLKYLSLESVEEGMVLSGDVYDPYDSMLISTKGTKLTQSLLSALKRRGIRLVPVYVEKIELTKEPKLPPVEAMLDEKIKKEAVSGIRNLFLSAEGGNTHTTAYQAVKELNGIVDNLIDTISKESSALVRISDLKSYDEYTYHHSLSVSILSIAIGRKLNLSPAMLQTIGRCAIMHDIGKILVPVKLINKKGRLTDDEFAQVKYHAEYGYDYLRKNNLGDEEIRRGVLSHHEKHNGMGYPHNLKGNDIPFLSRIISVADVYDAITSYRSYRTPMPPSEAIEMIMSEVGRSFDYEIVAAFVEIIEMYPKNTCVELSNKRLGIVIENKHSMRPKLKMSDDGEIVDLMDRQNWNLVITRVADGFTAGISKRE